MFDPLEHFRSVGIVWGAWLVSLALLWMVVQRAVGKLRRATLRRLLRQEQGAAYTLSYVMTFPLYALLLCLVIETTLVLIAKTGTVYAAYAAARAAAVWESAKPAGRMQAKAQLAAVHALVPFGSGSTVHQPLGGATPEPARLAAYLTEYRAHAPAEPVAEGYLTRKYRYALAATRVDLRSGEDKIEATVHYDVPLHIPGVGRLLGERPSSGASYYVYRIESRVAITSETPKTPTRDIGIDYHSE